MKRWRLRSGSGSTVLLAGALALLLISDLLSPTNVIAVVLAQEKGGVPPVPLTNPAPRPLRRAGSSTPGSRRAASSQRIAAQIETTLVEANKARDAKRYDQAEKYYHSVERLDPNDERASLGLGNIYLEQSRYPEAIGAYQRAIGLKPQDPTPYYILGYIYAVQKNYEAAIAKYREAGRLQPRDLKPHNFIADIFNKLGRYGDAIEEYKRNIEIDPQRPEPYNYVAWLLATSPQPEARDGQQAVEYARKGCELTKWRDPDYLDTLAAAYAEAGDFQQAVAWEKKALEFPKYVNDSKVRSEAEQRLDLYTRGQKYRMK